MLRYPVVSSTIQHGPAHGSEAGAVASARPDAVGTAHREAPRWDRTDAMAILLAAIVLVIFRLHAFGLPLENDECNYAYMGKRLLEGDRLYIDLWDHQPPGVFVLFAVVIRLFGDAPTVFRMLALAASLASLAAIYGIARTTAGRTAAFAAAALFAFVSSDPGTGGEGCNRETFMNALILAAWLVVLSWRESPWKAWLLAGALLGIASALKTVVAVHWMLLAGWLLAQACRNGPRSRRRESLMVLIFFSVGPIAVWAGTSMYFAATGRWNEFVDAVFAFNLGYGGEEMTLIDRFASFFKPFGHPFKFESAFPLWIAAIPASIWLTAEAIRRRSAERLALLLLLLAGFSAVCLPGRFWPHYYYLMVPACVVAVSVTVGDIVRLLHLPISSLIRGGRSRRFVPGILVLLALPAFVFVSEARHYLLQPPFGITVKRYNSRDFWARAQGENVARVTGSGNKVFVFGNEASIYYYSGRRCASRYTMVTGLSAGMRGADQRRRTLIEELERDPPRLIVVLFNEPPFPEWRDFLTRHYGEPAGWDYHDRTREPIMFVLARKDQPIEPLDWDWDRASVGGWQLGERP